MDRPNSTPQPSTPPPHMNSKATLLPLPPPPPTTTTNTNTTRTKTSNPPPISATSPVLIIGAGIVGLTLAHALARSHIPHRIYDRDSDLSSRGPGWAISIHWARPALEHCLPPTVVQAVQAAQVCPSPPAPTATATAIATATTAPTTDTGRRSFLFLDLRTARPRFEIPIAPLWRLNRGRFREVLSCGVPVGWGKRVVGLRVGVRGDDGDGEGEGEGKGRGVEYGDVLGDGGGEELGSGVEVLFADGERVRGAMVVGADGANSRVRQLLCPNTFQLERLPIRMLGTTVRLAEEEYAPLRAIHPMLFQGCHSETGTFMWFSIISAPETNGSAEMERPIWEAQVNLSWRLKDGDEEPPVENVKRVRLMKELARPFEERLRTLIDSISEENVVEEIRLQDWPTVEWPNHGRVTLIGDAAHAMTMYRGEACNHGIVDAQMLHDTILSIYKGEVSQAAALDEFDRQVGVRTRDGVLLSRQACLDAHDFHALKSDSPLVSKRALIRTPGMEVSQR